MKRLVLSFLLFLYGISCSSQVWIDQGASWHYDYWTIGWYGQFNSTYTQDTTINGIQCQKIETERYSFGQSSPGVWVSSGPLYWPTNCTYTSNDTVYYWNETDNDFFVLYDFGASIGDQWIVGHTNTGFVECNDTSIVIVVDTGSVNINSMNYRYIDLQPESNSSIGMSGRFVERFGNMTENDAPFQWNFPLTFGCDSIQGTVEWYWFNFKCFEDNSFSLYNPSGEDCEWWINNVSIDEESEIDIIYFPNPVEDKLQIIIPDGDFEITIHNSVGQTVRHKKLQGSGSIQVEGLSTGIYIIYVKDNMSDQQYKDILIVK